ncbi:MAG TPA: (Fe-S)-binding protein [Methanocella sp.]|nr:(Fe-S)-binding protein [Methanocella sp.]
MGENIVEKIELPGLDCGLCGAKTCEEFARILIDKPGERKRCVQIGKLPTATHGSCTECGVAPAGKDSLEREYDFVLDAFPEDPGPRETIIPHNPMMTREMEVNKGDILIGRPLGMSCGCPVTHCGVAMDVDRRTGVIVWCVTGPLANRGKPVKDLGFYSAQAYEGLVKETQKDLKIGMRYWYLPRRCMLQWRHSGTVIFINRTKEGVRVRIEGIMIG